MAKIDMSELQDLKSRLNSKQSDFTAEANNLTAALSEFTEMNHFKGEAAQNIKSYVTGAHMPVVQAMMELLQDENTTLNSLITSFKTDVGEYSDSAKLDSTEMKAFESDYKDSLDKLQNATDDFKDALNKVSDIVSSVSVSSSDFSVLGKDVLDKTKDTREKFSDWRSAHKTDFDDLADRVSNLSKTSKLMGRATQGGGDYSAKRITAISKKVSKVEREDLVDKVNKFKDSAVYKISDGVDGVVAFPGKFKKMKTGKHRQQVAYKVLNKYRGQAANKIKNYALASWRKVKKGMRNSGKAYLRNFEKAHMKNSLAQNIKNLKRKFSKVGEFNVLSAFGKKFNLKQVTGGAYKTIKKGVEVITSSARKNGIKVAKWAIGKAPKLTKFIPKAGKLIGKAIPGVSYAINGLSAVNSAYEGYKDPKSPAYHSVPKSVVHAGVAAIKSAGPLEGAAAGAAIAGPAGAVVGGVLGTVNTVAQAIAPDLTNKIYDNAERTIDKGVDAVGKAVKSFANSFKMPKLGW